MPSSPERASLRPRRGALDLSPQDLGVPAPLPQTQRLGLLPPQTPDAGPLRPSSHTPRGWSPQIPLSPGVPAGRDLSAPQAQAGGPPRCESRRSPGCWSDTDPILEPSPVCVRDHGVLWPGPSPCSLPGWAPGRGAPGWARLPQALPLCPSPHRSHPGPGGQPGNH